VIENGFYYDFAYKRPFTPEDLRRSKSAWPNWRRRISRSAAKSGRATKAVKFFLDRRALQGRTDRRDSGRPGGLAVPRRRFHRPLPRPARAVHGKLKVFKLMKVAGAYWRGDHRNEQLQRIYGTAWAKKEDLDAYLHMLEEAEKRDHRRLGKQLDLFHMQDEAPGWCSGTPRAGRSGRKSSSTCAPSIATTATRKCAARRSSIKVAVGEVRPLGALQGQHVHHESEKRDYAVKPMNCPGHVQIFNTGLRSYRDLPLRYGEFGSCHRNEPSGALHG
jgi:threonyl-tRNA synthetase